MTIERKKLSTTWGDVAYLEIGASIGRGELKNEVEILRNLDAALAVLHGAEDAFVSLEYIEKLAIPRLWRDEVQVIDGAGHYPHVEKPEKFNALLGAFVESCS